MEKIFNIIKRLLPRRLFRFFQPAYHYILSWLAAAICHHPSERLIVIGVTGTTGKTTSVYLTAKVLAAAGYRVGFTSTAMFSDGVKEWLNDKKMTMPGRFFVQRMLARMLKNGCQYAVVETTSEGIAQFRHRFINYDIIAITGLYPEHIEAHGSFGAYREAKGRLFAHLRLGRPKYCDEKKRVRRASGLKKLDLKRVKKTSIVNLDDEHAGYFLSFWAERKIGLARDWPAEKTSDWAKKNAEIFGYGKVRSGRRGLSFRADGGEIKMRLMGEFNSANAMIALAVGRAEDISFLKSVKALEAISGVAGRLERIDEGQDFTVIVDYAFEPKAVAKLYQTVRKLPHERIIHVFGSAGGGRDIARRPKLGRLAGENADIAIVTNEDPYDDDPEIIMEQVAVGAEQAGKKNGLDLFKIIDRRAAIRRALSAARAGDLVLISGKGSEQAICAARGERIPWDDRAVVRGILNEIKDQA